MPERLTAAEVAPKPVRGGHRGKVPPASYQLIELLPAHARARWWQESCVQDFYAAAAEMELDRSAGQPQVEFQGRGVVICGGGKYFASAYVTIRALRHVGCLLPIQLWYLGRRGEMDDELTQLVKPLNVECIDADQMRIRHPFRVLNGFQLKVFATRYSSFREVLFLDADCYPARNPESLLNCPHYRSDGAIFWSDLAHTAEWTNWQAFRVAWDGRPPFESGQFLIDKQRCWAALTLALWYNDHCDFTYRHAFGDKDLWHIAFVKAGQPYAMYMPEPLWQGPAYVHAAADQLPQFVHRCRDKYSLAAAKFTTAQYTKVPSDSGLPLEAECRSWLNELRDRIGSAI
jgi:hypothetical protein